jgi:hypothetical protein
VPLINDGIAQPDQVSHSTLGIPIGGVSVGSQGSANLTSTTPTNSDFNVDSKPD